MTAEKNIVQDPESLESNRSFWQGAAHLAHRLKARITDPTGIAASKQLAANHYQELQRSFDERMDGLFGVSQAPDTAQTPSNVVDIRTRRPRT